MNARLRRVYLVSQPVGVVRHAGQDIGISGEVTGALTTTVLSGNRAGWFRCHTRALAVESADVETCLTFGSPDYVTVSEVLIDMLAGIHTAGNRHRRSRSGAELATEAERILGTRDYTACLLAVDGIQVPGVRLNSSSVAADEATGLFLLTHGQHLVSIESYDDAGDPEALATEPVAPV